MYPALRCCTEELRVDDTTGKWMAFSFDPDDLPREPNQV
jgi:hypothetical protein